MKKLLCLVIICIITKLHAGSYYFSSSTGNDNRLSSEAQNPSTPWRTLQKLNSIFNTLKPGDKIYLKRGDSFEGTINITKSGSLNNPIIFDAYGTGTNPIISGFTTLKQWVNIGGGIFEASNSSLGNSVNILLVNDKPVALGRYPNASAPNKGYLSFESSNKNISITDNQLPNSPNWSGAEVVIRKNRWVVDKNKIIIHSGHVITYASVSHYNADPNYGYFIQNDPKTLDIAGEWYYAAPQKKIGLYSGNAVPVNVKASTLNSLINCNNQTDISFNNILFQGANENAFELNKTLRISINNSHISFSGANAINALNCNNLTVENSIITYANNISLNLGNCSNTIIRNNTITATGVFTGMGKGDAGSYEAIMIAGNNNLVELNKIDSTGYIPVTFSGNSVTIKNNFISNFAFVKDDAGGIYTYNGSGIPQINTNRKISGNIIIKGTGAGDGTPDPQSAHVSGIYIDDKSNHVAIENNTVAFCSKYGIYLHNADNINLTGNTFFDNQQQAGFVHDNNAASNPIRNIVSQNNIFFSKDPVSNVAEFKSTQNDITSFGTFDNNYYCRPADDFLVINTSRKENNTVINKQFDLDGWKAAFSKDINSKTSPFKLKTYQLNNLAGSNKFPNGNFNASTSGLYTWAAAGNSRISWNSNALDSGTLQLSFSSITGPKNKALIIIATGAVTAGKTYLLRFSLKGNTAGKFLQVYLRKSLSGYNDLSKRVTIKVVAGRTENEVLFTASAFENNASIVIEAEEQQPPLYFDNIQLNEANVKQLNINDLIHFEYNPSAATRTISLADKYIDVNSKQYSGSLTLPPFSSVILIKQQGATVPDTVTSLQGCKADGYAINEHWNNITGNNISNIPVEITPSKTENIAALEIKSQEKNYATRIRGLICPPQTGQYTFYISGDDAGELWLSSDDDPAKKIRIARFLSCTNFREWTKFSSQTSAGITLKANTKYYFEVLHKQGGGDGHLSIGWKLPGGQLQLPLPGPYFSPFRSIPISLNNSGKLDISKLQQ